MFCHCVPLLYFFFVPPACDVCAQSEKGKHSAGWLFFLKLTLGGRKHDDHLSSKKKIREKKDNSNLHVRWHICVLSLYTFLFF